MKPEKEDQKITAHLPAGLLIKARKVTGKGITETLKLGLEKVALGGVYMKMLNLKGKHRIKIDLDELRKDRT